MGSPVISVPTEEIVARTNKKPGFRETGPFSSPFTLGAVVQEVITQLFVLLLVPIHINPQTTRGHFSNRKNLTPIVNKHQTQMGSFHLPLREDLSALLRQKQEKQSNTLAAWAKGNYSGNISCIWWVEELKPNTVPYTSHIYSVLVWVTTDSRTSPHGADSPELDRPSTRAKWSLGASLFPTTLLPVQCISSITWLKAFEMSPSLVEKQDKHLYTWSCCLFLFKVYTVMFLANAVSSV